MLEGGKLSATRAYYLIVFGEAFLFTFADNILILYQTTEAGLSAFQLVLIAGAYRVVILLAEVPTGLVADTVSRRRSVVIGLALLGIGLMVGGAQPEFVTILLGQLIMGLGYAFMSGAHQAWIADEIGVERANGVYVRVAQLSMWFWLAAVPLSVLVATVDITLPVVLGGVLLVAVAAVLAVTMPETGFRPPVRAEHASFRAVLRSVGETYSSSVTLLRMRPLLMTMFVITVFYGVAGLGFQRLWLIHFNENIGYPDRWGFGPVEWFGAMRLAAAVMSLVALQFISRKGARALSTHEGVTRWLFVINAFQLNTLLLLAATSSFELAAFAYCATFALSYALDPFQLAWINQNASSEVRATVISMNSQADALGRTFGTPVIGLVSGWASVRAGLALSSLVLLAPLALYFRAYSQGSTPVVEGQQAGTSDVS